MQPSMAGFWPFAHPGRGRRADTWLKYIDPLPAPVRPARSDRLAAMRQGTSAPARS